MQVTSQNREIIPLRWEHLILSLDPKGIVVLYLFTNILFFARCETADHMNEFTDCPSTCAHAGSPLIPDSLPIGFSLHPNRSLLSSHMVTHHIALERCHLASKITTHLLFFISSISWTVFDRKKTSLQNLPLWSFSRLQTILYLKYKILWDRLLGIDYI